MFKVKVAYDTGFFMMCHPFNGNERVFNSKETAINEVFASRYLCGQSEEGMLVLPLSHVIRFLIVEDKNDIPNT